MIIFSPRRSEGTLSRGLSGRVEHCGEGDECHVSVSENFDSVQSSEKGLGAANR